ncbi:MAG: hypothetical protein ACE5MI_09830 [Acidimicrobiia bacterium]
MPASAAMAATATTRRYRIPVMELLGLSDTAELTISLPASPTDDLSIDLHATTLVVAPPEEPVTVIPEVDPEDWEGVPSLADVQTSDETDTGALIGKLWEATEESLILEEEWAPEEPESARRSYVPFWIVGGAAVLVATVAAVWVATGSNTRSNEDLRVEYAEASAQLRETTALVAGTLDPITSLDVETGDVSGAAAAIADLEAAARRATGVASEAPPTGPFQETDPDIEPIRANLRTAAERAGELELRLAEVLTYQLLLDRSFQLPPLPYAITQDNIPALGVEITLATAETTEAVDQLPRDPALANHRQRVVNFAERLETWQVEYLEAVRNDDLDATSALIEEFETGVANLRRDLETPLERIRGWVDSAVDYVLAALDRIDDLLAES